MEANLKIVILYSGGLDSFLMKKYADKMYGSIGAIVKCVYFKHGTASEQAEIARLPKFVEVKSIDWLNNKITPQAKKDDPFAGKIYIPGRNLVFSALAACEYLPDEVWMGTTYDEDNFKATDKNEKFRQDTSDLLSYVLSPFINKVKIRFPFVEKQWTKYDSIAWALRNGVSKSQIAKTISCWNQKGDVACGVCKQCFKRQLIFLLHGIKQKYAKDPIDSSHGRKLLAMYVEAGLNPNVVKNLDEENVFDMIRRCYSQKLFSVEAMQFLRQYFDPTGED